jgi:hypothetical protein
VGTAFPTAWETANAAHPPFAAPRLLNVPHSVSVHASVPHGDAEGVLFAMGGVDAGFALYVQNGKLIYGYNYVAAQHFKVQSDGSVPEGDHVFSFEFTPTGQPDVVHGKGVPAGIKLFVDGKQVGAGDLPVTVPLLLGLGGGVSLGSYTGSPVMPGDEPPFAFTGTVKRALVDITGEAIEDEEARIKAYLAAAMSRQ